MKHFLSALALGCLLLSCNRDNETNETPAPPQNEKLVLLKSASPGGIELNYKNRNEIESLSTDGMYGKSDIKYEYDAYGRIIKERRFSHRYDYGETNITYQYDGQGRLTSSHAISTEFYPGTGLTPRCSVEKKHAYTYQGSKVIVKIEIGTDTCSAIPETGKEKTITLLVENGKVVKSLDENNQIIETIEYYNTKNALRDIKGYPALVSEFYLRDKFTYDLIGYGNDIEYFSDLRFIDNVKTISPIFDGYLLYQYLDHDRNEYNGDYPEVVRIVKKSHNNPTNESEWDWHERYYIEEQ